MRGIRFLVVQLRFHLACGSALHRVIRGQILGERANLLFQLLQFMLLLLLLLFDMREPRRQCGEFVRRRCLDGLNFVMLRCEFVLMRINLLLLACELRLLRAHRLNELLIRLLLLEMCRAKRTMLGSELCEQHLHISRCCCWSSIMRLRCGVSRLFGLCDWLKGFCGIVLSFACLNALQWRTGRLRGIGVRALTNMQLSRMMLLLVVMLKSLLRLLNFWLVHRLLLDFWLDLL